MTHWTPFEFAVAITMSACGLVAMTTVMVFVIQPAITISDWLDMKMKLWWRGKNGNTDA